MIEHDASVTTIASPVNNTIVVTGSKDKSVILWSFKDGTIIHKLTAHQDIIVKVAIKNDGSITISGTVYIIFVLFSLKLFLIIIIGSRDGVVNVWSSYYGVVLTSINLQYTLSDFILTNGSAKLVFKLEDSPFLPIVRLTNKSPKDSNRTMSLSSLKSLESIISNLFY